MYPVPPNHSLFVVVQLLGYVRLFLTPWTTARQAALFFTISWSLLKLMLSLAWLTFCDVNVTTIKNYNDILKSI